MVYLAVVRGYKEAIQLIVSKQLYCHPDLTAVRLKMERRTRSSVSFVYLTVVRRCKESSWSIAIPRPIASVSTSHSSRAKMEHRTRSSVSFVYLTVRS